jgi:ectoine hydroxylase-related dioxygenase (phytanoyl-CoA dioxygenase family)
MRDGFYLADELVVSATILEKAVDGMDAVRDGEYDTGVPPTEHPGYDPGKLCKINNAHRSDSGLRALVTDGALARMVASITGSEMLQVWASQLLIKPPGSSSGGHIGWHQDRQYWGYWQGEEGLFTMWIALSEVAENSGPMQFVRGSHRWGFLNEGDFFSDDNEMLKDKIQSASGEAWDEVGALLPPGGLSIHNCLVYHGSGPNTSNSSRCSVAVHLRNEKATPVPGKDNYYVSHLDNPLYCPLIYAAEKASEKGSVQYSCSK